MDAPNQTPAPWTTLAHILRPQGRKGELLAELFTDFPDKFESRSDLYLAPPNFAGAAGEARAVSITNHWLPLGRNHGRVVLTFAGIDSISLAETLAGLDVLVPADQRVPLDDDTEYISDLIGCRVFDLAADAETEVGSVIAVDFPTTSDGNRRLADAAPLLTVQTPTGEEILIPYVQTFITHLDVANQRISMTLPPGLIDLNR